MRVLHFVLAVLISLPAFSSELIDCPKENPDDEVVYLQSQDGKCVKLEKRIAEFSLTIKNLIDDAGVENIIPLPNLTNQTLLDVAAIGIIKPLFLISSNIGQV